MTTWYSQFGEDEYIYNTFFQESKTGTYFEAGAMDGIRFSNTKAFEERGWVGVLVEPSPTQYELLVSNRPKDYVFGCALGPNSDEAVSFEYNVNRPEVSYIVDKSTERSSSHWKHEEHRSMETDTCTLSRLFKSTNTTHINFFSLDVEGYELKALQGMDWSVKVDVFLIEMLGGENDEGVRDLLKTNGYKFHSKIHFNEVWVPDDNVRGVFISHMILILIMIFVMHVLESGTKL